MTDAVQNPDSADSQRARKDGMGMSVAPPSHPGNGFDGQLGLDLLELTPDGGSARLEITDKLLQPWGIVHGGVYCSIIESLASAFAAVWLSANGDGTGLPFKNA